jgi:hypothetical protein
VQEADDEERGRANAMSEETGKCWNTIEGWGHPSSRHSCNGPTPTLNALAPKTSLTGGAPPRQPRSRSQCTWGRVGL